MIIGQLSSQCSKCAVDDCVLSALCCGHRPPPYLCYHTALATIIMHVLSIVPSLWALGSQTALWHSALDCTHLCAFSVLSSLCYCTVLSTVLSTPCSTSVLSHCARHCALTFCSHTVLDTVCSGALLSIVIAGVPPTVCSGTVLASVLSHCSLLLPVCSHIELLIVLSTPCHRLCTLCSWLWTLAFLSILLSPLCP